MLSFVAYRHTLVANRTQDYLDLCLFLRSLFLRLCVDILCLFFFFPLGILFVFFVGWKKWGLQYFCLSLCRLNLCSLVYELFYVNFRFLRLYFTFSASVWAGLKAIILCSGMMSSTFFDMFLPTFFARVLRMKLPKPRRYTFSPETMEAEIVRIMASTHVCTVDLSIPVSLEIADTISCFVMCVYVFFSLIFQKRVQRYDFQMV